jgi:nucleoside-diphosphate-sugar epimerase
MKILITGSEGFVGSKLQIELIKIGHELFLTDRVYKKEKENYFRFNLGTDPTHLIVQHYQEVNFDIVIHLAAAKGDFMLSDNDFYRDNVLATEALIEILDLLNVSDVIHYSTVSVYGHNNRKKDETAALNPNNTYGKTKLASEKTLINWQSSSNRNLTILRPSVIYGEDNFANMYNLLSLLNRKFPITIGKGDYIKSMIAVENLIDITIFVTEKTKGLQIYNCTDEPYLTLKQCMEDISELQGFKMPLLKLPISLAILMAIPFEILSFLTKRDFKVTRDRIHKYSMATDYRSDLIRSVGYKQMFSTKERLQNMAKWYIKLNKTNP